MKTHRKASTSIGNTQVWHTEGVKEEGFIEHCTLAENSVLYIPLHDEYDSDEYYQEQKTLRNGHFHQLNFENLKF